jgi:hypothetical protein
MCLPVTPYRVEREWKHAGLSCAVVQAQKAQHRCGYVRVPPSHPLHGKDYDADEVNVDVHGGLTFAEIEPCKEHLDGQGWWFGFDCAHCMDLQCDPNAELDQLSPDARQRFEIFSRFHPRPGEHFWTQAEVEAEIERLADQLAAQDRVAG